MTWRMAGQSGIVEGDEAADVENAVATQEIGQDVVEEVAAIDKDELSAEAFAFHFGEGLVRRKFAELNEGVEASDFEQGDCGIAPIGRLERVDGNVAALGIVVKCGGDEDGREAVGHSHFDGEAGADVSDNAVE